MVKVFGAQPHLSVLQSTAATLQSWKMVNKDFSTNPLFFSLLWLTSAVNPSCSTLPQTKVSYNNFLSSSNCISNVSDFYYLSQCLEDGSWTSLDISCVFDPSTLVFSDWPAVTISILCVVIIILAIIIFWSKGSVRCHPHTKSNFISKGVNASTITHSVIDSDMIKSPPHLIKSAASTSSKYKAPLSTFHR